MDKDKPVAYLVFQGGGAKGISHVGGLAAVNEMELEIGGVAGTSAGAIVAALVAAGYSAQEMFDGGAGEHILKHLCGGKFADPTNLFSQRGWRSLQRLIHWTTRISTVLAWLVAGPLWRRGITFATMLAAMASLILLGMKAPGAELVIAVLAVLILTLKAFGVYRGLCGLDNVRIVVDEALRRKLGTTDREITFEQLRAAGCIPLKLVSTNVTDGGLELFSYETTPRVIVADAVCASVCIPFVFKRWSFRFTRRDEMEESRRQFIDGGLMSNLPAWSFDEERSVNEDAITIAFGLQGSEADRTKSTWLMSALNAVVTGPPQIHRRGINRLVHVPLKSPLGLLDFDQTFANYKAAVESARDDAFALIDFEVTEVPVLMRKSLGRLLRVVQQLLYQTYKGTSPGTSSLFRLALAVQRPGMYSTMNVAYKVGKYRRGDPTVLSIEQSPVGLAWLDRDRGEPVLELFREGSGRPFCDSKWMLPVPLPVANPDEDPQKAALAVVLIIDSPSTLGSLWHDEDGLKDFSSFLYQSMITYGVGLDIGGMVRRSVSWL